jgi:hypothetical protein
MLNTSSVLGFNVIEPKHNVFTKVTGVIVMTSLQITKALRRQLQSRIHLTAGDGCSFLLVVGILLDGGNVVHANLDGF